MKNKATTNGYRKENISRNKVLGVVVSLSTFRTVTLGVMIKSENESICEGG